MSGLRKRALWLGSALVLGAAVFVAGNWVWGELRYAALLESRRMPAGERDIAIKAERNCPPASETLIFVIFGQSNAANHGEARLSAPEGASDFYNGRCFIGDDPQFGATAMAGSPWPAFANALRETGETRPILTATVAVGNTRAVEWQADTANGRGLEETVRALQERGYRIAAFLYFQGEADRETPEAEYRTALNGIARSTAALSKGTPLIVSNSSICGEGQTSASALRRARQAVADANEHVVIGPDTDSLGTTYRFDACHFSVEGLRAVGKMWADSVTDVASD